LQPLVATADTRYFDFWVGTWQLLREDGAIDTTTSFVVKRSIHPAAYEEVWKQGGNISKAIRAWDKTNNRWGFVWISANGLFQVWDTMQSNGHWYLHRTFTVNNDTYRSRQGFLPQPDGTVLRVSEKSYDGIGWETRFQQRLK
jgi:hypothetical protein